ncbi:hypothetical protein DL770_011225 [Monosporascus sp. CRB-9-2]|nr:hypothetical protein DL770_011225 [Monosporascus sp. CRB-9-2]
MFVARFGQPPSRPCRAAGAPPCLPCIGARGGVQQPSTRGNIRLAGVYRADPLVANGRRMHVRGPRKVITAQCDVHPGAREIDRPARRKQMHLDGRMPRLEARQSRDQPPHRQRRRMQLVARWRQEDGPIAPLEQIHP